MNAEMQICRGRTTIIFLKRFFAALIVVCTCVFSTPVCSAETGNSGVVEKATEETVEKIAEKAAGRAAEKAVEKAIQKATEKTMKKAAAKAAQEEAEQTELTAKRPDELKGSTTVHFMVFIVDIDDIDDAAQNFTANVYLRLR